MLGDVQIRLMERVLRNKLRSPELSSTAFDTLSYYFGEWPSLFDTITRDFATV
jgi:hypothetical protein